MKHKKPDLVEIGRHYGYRIYIDLSSHDSGLTRESIIQMTEKLISDAHKMGDLLEEIKYFIK